ncbi:MAG: FtsQ-type POTRA domain-containing protein [Thermodesulfobacteriota bacterium]
MRRRAAATRRAAARLRRASAPRAESSRWRIRNVVFFLLAGGFCFTLGPLMRYCMEHRYFAVRAIDIEGLDRLDASKVRAWLGMVEGSSIWQASPQVLVARLEAQAAIAGAEVRRLWPDRLRVVVHERRPRAILRTDAGLFLLDQSGAVIDPADGFAGELPIVSVDAARWREAYPERAQPELPLPRELREAVRVARLFESGLAGIRVSEVALQPPDGGERRFGGNERPHVVAFSEDGRLAMRLGWGDWRDKLSSLRRVLAHASASVSGVVGAEASEEVAIGRLAGSVDVSDPRSVVARWVTSQGMI